MSSPDAYRMRQVTGMTGCGKSHLVNSMLAQETRVIVAQPFSKDAFGTMRFRGPAELLAAFQKKRPLRFRVSLAVNSQEEFAWLCAFAWVVAPVTLVLDETAPYIPNPSDVPMEFKRICQMGRHAGPDEKSSVAVIAIGQRPVNLPPIFRSEVGQCFLFRVNSHDDRKLIRNDLGLSKEQAESLGTLEQYQYMKVDRFGGVTYEKTKA